MTSTVLFVLRTNRSNGNAPCADHWPVPSARAFTPEFPIFGQEEGFLFTANREQRFALI